MSEPVTVRERAGGLYTQDVLTTRHHLFADEPISMGSTDIGPSPYEYLCAALGACTSMTLRMYAEHKKWLITHISVDVSHKKSVDQDGQSEDIFSRTITIDGDLSDAQRLRLGEIADKCPVHKTLESGATIETSVAD